MHQYKLFGKQGVGSLFAALEERAALTLKIERVILLVCQTSTKSPPAMFASLAKRRHWQPASAIRGRSIGFCPLHYPQACFSRPAFLRQALCQSLASWDFVYLVWTDLGSLDQPVARAVVEINTPSHWPTVQVAPTPELAGRSDSTMLSRKDLRNLGLWWVAFVAVEERKNMLGLPGMDRALRQRG